VLDQSGMDAEGKSIDSMYSVLITWVTRALGGKEKINFKKEQNLNIM